MDRQKMLLLLGGLLCASVGCTSSGKSILPTATPIRSTAQYKPAPIPEEPVGKPRPETMVAFGDIRAAAALEGGRSDQDKDILLREARATYAQALEIDPKNYSAHMSLAKLYADMGDREKAIETYKKTARIHPERHEVWYEIGVVYGRMKDWNSAAENFHEAVKRDPDNRHYRKTLGFTLARAARYEEGYAWLAKSMPEAQARYNIALMMKHTKNDSGSRQQLELALRADPAYEPAKEFLTTLKGGDEPSGIQAVGYEERVGPTVPQTEPFPLNRQFGVGKQ